MKKNTEKDLEEQIQQMMERREIESEALRKILDALDRKNTDLNIKPDDQSSKD